MSVVSAPDQPKRQRAPRKPRSATSLSLTANDVAALIGVSPKSFAALRAARPDFPRPVPPLWPQGRALYDRALVVAWWRERVLQAQQSSATPEPLADNAG